MTPSAPPAPRRSFLYTDVASRLRGRITRGIYRAGQRLPSLVDLMQEFQVSAITVRRAVSELVYEGLLRGHQGLGIFVKEKPKIHRVLAGDPERSIGDEIAQAGFTPRLREAGAGEVSADAEVAQRLGVARGSKVHMHQKVTFADDQPVALHILYMRPKIARQLRRDLSREYIFRLLHQRRVPFANLKFELSAASLSDEHSRLLDLPAGSAMLRVEFAVQPRRGAPLMIGVTQCRADRFVFEFDLPRRARKGAARRGRP